MSLNNQTLRLGCYFPPYWNFWLRACRHRGTNFLTAFAISKECETNHNRVQKNAAVFANRNSWRKVTITHSHKSSWWAQQIHVTKEKMATLNLIKVLYAGPKSTRNIDKLKPEPGPTRNRSRPDLQLYSYHPQASPLDVAVRPSN